MGSIDPGAWAAAKRVVFRLYRYRPRSEKEIIDTLTQKKVSQEIINHTVCYFKKNGFINDRAFAQSWIQSRLNKPFGINRIKKELEQKGIASATVNEIYARLTETYSESEQLHSLALKRWRCYNSLNRLTAKRRLFAFLARRGFSSSAIYQTIENISLKC